MNNNFDDSLFEHYKDLSFEDAKPVAQIPALAKLQTQHIGKSQITLQVDNEILAIFKARAESIGSNYQTLINEALRQFSQGLTLSDMIRETIRQELHHH